MVILQFNKLIRNKWVWGVFAIAVSAAFCFDDLFSGRRGDEERSAGEAGTLAGEKVDAKVFLAIAEDLRGLGRARDWQRKTGEINREAWENYAALKVATDAGAGATDNEVQSFIRSNPSFQANGQFSFQLYQRLLAQNGIVPERYEDALKRQRTLSNLDQALVGSSVWVSPMELDQALADMTDKLTVRVARFVQEPKDAQAVKVDEAAIRRWYDANTNSLALPERVKLRLVRYDATQKDVLAKMAVSEDDIRDRFDITADKYTVKDTNGVESVKRFDQLTKEEKSDIERELRQIAAVQFYETNLNARVYGTKAAKGKSRLDEIAQEDGLKVTTSEWFATDGSCQDGFMARASTICPGAQGFGEAVAELDPTSEDLRYAVIGSEKAVWLVEKAETSPKHLPTFAEAKDVIRPRVLRDAKADAFKAAVEAVAKKGAKAVLAGKDVSTNLTFCVSEMKQGDFADQRAIVGAAMKLKKGEVSEFTLTAPGRALLVVCEAREPGDAAKAMIFRSNAQTTVQMLQQRDVQTQWPKWNLERLGFEPGEVSSVDVSDDTAE